MPISPPSLLHVLLPPALPFALGPEQECFGHLLLLALVEFRQPLAGFSYLRVVWIEAQVSIRFGR
jgi:hypothetical protein